MNNTAQKEAMDRAGELPLERRVAERRALASHPAAPTDLPAIRYYHTTRFFDADYVEFAEGAKMGAGVKDGVAYSDKHYTRAEAESFVAQGSWRKGITPAAPPVQQTGDVRDPLAEFTAYVVTNYPADTIIGDPAWHAPRLFRAAQQALATTRPSAALTREQIGEVAQGIYGTAATEQEHAFARAILAASGGAHAAPIKGAYLNNQGNVTLCQPGREREGFGFVSMLAPTQDQGEGK